MFSILLIEFHECFAIQTTFFFSKEYRIEKEKRKKMLEIDAVADYLYTRIHNTIQNFGLQYSDVPTTPPTIKQFKLHKTADEVIPFAIIHSFLLQFSNDLILETKSNRCLYSFSVEGPIPTPQPCFLNRLPHTHYIWNIIVTL